MILDWPLQWSRKRKSWMILIILQIEGVKIFFFISLKICQPTLQHSCENSCFSLLLATWNISQGGVSVTRRQKFHTDNINQCFHITFGIHGVPNANMLNFTFLLVDLVLCCGHLRTSSSTFQMLLLKKYIYHKFWLACYRLIAFIFDLWSLLSYVCHS